MNPNTNAWNRIRYGLYAPVYDLVARRLDSGRQRSIEALGLQPDERILVPGCGTGLDFEYLPPSLRGVAGDLSPAMVRKAQARADALGLDADVHVMDAHALDLPDGSFDAAEPSLVRRAASVVTNVIATDLNRRLGPLLDASGLVLEREEPVLFGSLFRVAFLRKPVSDPVPSHPVPDA